MSPLKLLASYVLKVSILEHRIILKRHEVSILNTLLANAWAADRLLRRLFICTQN